MGFQDNMFRGISTHALLAEGDPMYPYHNRIKQHFNPRPPCGGRHLPLTIQLSQAEFQPTPSLRRATKR